MNANDYLSIIWGPLQISAPPVFSERLLAWLIDRPLDQIENCRAKDKLSSAETVTRQIRELLSYGFSYKNASNRVENFIISAFLSLYVCVIVAQVLHLHYAVYLLAISIFESSYGCSRKGISCANRTEKYTPLVIPFAVITFYIKARNEGGWIAREETERVITKRIASRSYLMLIESSCDTFQERELGRFLSFVVKLSIRFNLKLYFHILFLVPCTPFLLIRQVVK